MILKKSELEEIHNEIMDIYDLAEDVLKAVERKDAEDPELEVEIAEPLIKQIEESTDIVSEKYLDYVESGLNVKPSDAAEVEAAMRKVFTKATDLIEELKKIPSPINNIPKQKIEELAAMSEAALKKYKKKKPILPVIGYKVGQLIPGPIREMLTEQMIRLPKMEKFIYSVREVVGQFFRLTYLFLDLKLVNNVHNVIWGRKIPDLKAQALLEKERAEARRKHDLLAIKSHKEMIGRNKAGYSKEED